MDTTNENQKPILVLGAREYGSPETIELWSKYLIKLPYYYYYGTKWIENKLSGIMQKVGVIKAEKLSDSVFVLAFWNYRCKPDGVERVLRRAPDKRIVNQ